MNSRLKKWLKRGLLSLTFLGAASLLLVLLWLSNAIYRYHVRYPAEQRDWLKIRSSPHPVAANLPWREFRGLIHSHSELSHDCEVPFSEVLRVLQTNQIHFICLSDHCVDGRADFSVQWRGIMEEKLFIPGFEMRYGFMPFGVKSGTILSNTTDAATLARQVVEGGGVLFYAHPEEPRDLNLPELAGMEIFNTHTDFKQTSIWGILPDLLINQRRYPDQVFHAIARRPSAFLRRWDRLNQERHITGIAGNDCHQNTGLRAFYTTNATLLMEDTSPKTLAEFHLNPLTRPLVSWLFGPLQPGKKLFHVQLDPYSRMSRLVNTHVLARELSESEVLGALRAGRAFVGFDMVADSTGFRWWATNQTEMAVMGETLAFGVSTRLLAESPYACRFTVLGNGEVLHQTEGTNVEWTPERPGRYRVEAELMVRGEWIPWVYANPIHLK